MRKPISERGKRYHAYMQSKHWKVLRLSVFERDYWQCVECGSHEHLHAHHKLYRKNWRSAILSDLETRCRRCHQLEHRRHAGESFEAFDVFAREITDRMNRCAITPRLAEVRKIVPLINHQDQKHTATHLIRMSAMIRLAARTKKVAPHATYLRAWAWADREMVKMMEAA